MLEHLISELLSSNISTHSNLLPYTINHITPDCLVDEGHNKQLFEREDLCSPLIPLLPTSQCEAISTHENVYAKRGKKVNKNH